MEASALPVRQALRAAREHLGAAAGWAAQGDTALDLLAEELRLAHDALGAITGAPAIGLAVALVRRGRELLWIALGLLLYWSFSGRAAHPDAPEGA